MVPPHPLGKIVRLGVAALLLGGLTLFPHSSATAATPPAKPGDSSGFHTVYGPKTIGNAPIADFPLGLNVYVRAGTPHVSEMAAATKRTVGQLRRYGIDVRYKGVIHDAIKAKGTGYHGGDGEITVLETTNPNFSTCARDPDVSGHVISEAYALPTGEDFGSVKTVSIGSVVFCPDTFAHGNENVKRVAMHEMGHAVGLGHFIGNYRGQPQVMNPIVQPTTNYRAGDIAGLRYIAYQTHKLIHDSAAFGQVDAFLTTGDLSATGWAIAGKTLEGAGVRMILDGKVIESDSTGGERPDIVAKYHPHYKYPGFRLEGVAAPSTGVHKVCVDAYNPLTPSMHTVLGCQTFGQAATSSAAPSATASPAPSTPAPVHTAAAAGDTSSSPKEGVLIALVVVVAVLVIVGILFADRRRRQRSAGHGWTPPNPH